MSSTESTELTQQEEANITRRAREDARAVLDAWDGCYEMEDDGLTVQIRTYIPADIYEIRILASGGRDVDQRWRVHQHGPLDWTARRVGR